MRSSGSRGQTNAVLLLSLTDRGLYCEVGDFYVDPWKPVDRAIVTHAHADHARWGCKSYLAARTGAAVFRRRLGSSARIELVGFGEEVSERGVRVSLHPAGHILGSAQIRIEYRGEVWVVSGDYKVAPDPTCAPFEPVRCHTFITESTFGLPIYRWPSQQSVYREVDRWWRENREQGRTSVLFAYSLGKAQRLLAGIDASIGEIYTHGAVEKLVEDYRSSGIAMPRTTHVGEAPKGMNWKGHLVVAPPSTRGSTWLRRFGKISTGFASGWMRVRGPRRHRAVDRGFVLSDHADWDGLVQAIEETGAGRVWVTHGNGEPLARWLRERGRDAESLETRFRGEGAEDSEEAGAAEVAEAEGAAEGASKPTDDSAPPEEG